MKKFVLLLILALTLTGCGGDQEPQVTTTTVASAATTTTLTDGSTSSSGSTSSTDANTTTTTEITDPVQDTTTVTTTTTSKAPVKVTTTTKKPTTTTKKPIVTAPTSDNNDRSDVIDPITGEPVTVVKVEETVNGSGLKVVRTYWSDGTCTSVVECRYCHEFPCPDGGGEKCSEYNVKEDSAKTCQNCGLPVGDGHNGTCHGTIDWDNGGKLICNHYD